MTPTSAPDRRTVLAVADWAVDREVIVDALRPHVRADIGLLVPAWLHGLDWIGDPTASRPCAQLQLDNLVRLAASAGLRVPFAAVGYPEPVTAIGDAVDEWRAWEIVLFTNGRPVRMPYPFDLASRIARRTQLPVSRAHVPSRRTRGTRRAGHCEVRAPAAA